MSDYHYDSDKDSKPEIRWNKEQDDVSVIIFVSSVLANLPPSLADPMLLVATPPVSESDRIRVTHTSRHSSYRDQPS